MARFTNAIEQLADRLAKRKIGELPARSLEPTSVFHECAPGRRKPAVKVVDVFGNDAMTIVEVRV